MGNVFGYEKEKAQIKEIKNFIKNIDKYRELGIRIPRGLLLYGEPGVGKTSLISSLKDENVKLIRLELNSEQPNEVIIHDVFKKAKKESSMVIFIDELDKIAGTSQAFFMEENDEINKLLLKEIDTLTDNDGVMIAATCNNLESVGEGLIRPGRFDRVIHVGLPSESDRKAILKSYFDKIKLRQSFNLEHIVKCTAGCTGADLECIANESGIMAHTENKSEITEEHISRVMNRMIYKTDEKEMLNNKDELYKISIHEAGHALVALTINPESVISVTIRPQGDSMGHVKCIDDEEQLPSVEGLKKKIAISLGGRIAEREVFADISLGSSYDVCYAYEKARSLATRHAAYGYDLVLPISRSGLSISESTMVKIEGRIADVLNAEDARVSKIIRENKKTLLTIANSLMQKSVLTKEELLAIISVQSVSAA